MFFCLQNYKKTELFLACIVVWYNGALPLYQEKDNNAKKYRVMKNTDFSLGQIENVISASSDFDAIMGLMDDLDLHVVDIVKA